MKTRLYRPFLGLTLLTLLTGCASDGALTEMDAGKQASQFHYVTVDSLNLRACASTDCKIISVLERGDYGRIIAHQDGWVELNLEGKKHSGWVSGRYLSNEFVAKKAQTPASKAPPVAPPAIPDESLATPAALPPALNEELAAPQPRSDDTPPALSEELSDPTATGTSPPAISEELSAPAVTGTSPPPAALEEELAE